MFMSIDKNMYEVIDEILNNGLMFNTVVTNRIKKMIIVNDSSNSFKHMYSMEYEYEAKWKNEVMTLRIFRDDNEHVDLFILVIYKSPIRKTNVKIEKCDDTMKNLKKQVEYICNKMK